MQVWLDEEVDGQLGVWLERYLAVELRSGLPDKPGEHVVIVSGCPVNEDALNNGRAVILVEPEQDESDRVIRLLAGSERPRLDIVSHVAPRMRAERTWSLVLALANRVPLAARQMRAGPVSRSDLTAADPSGGSWLDLERAIPLFGRTIAFIGFTPMAWTVADLAAQQGMFPIYWVDPGQDDSRVDTEGAALRSGAREVHFDHLFEGADVIVLDVPFSEESLRLIDTPELALMRPDALLVNAAHGRAIDEGALLQALRDGRLGGVALDRFNYEPLPDDSPLRDVERVLLTPGIVPPTVDEILERTAAEVAGLIGPDADRLALSRRVRHVRRRRVSTT